MSDSNGSNGQQKNYSWSKNKGSYIVTGIIVLVLVAFGIYSYTHQNNVTQNYNQVTPNTTINNEATSTPTSTPASGGTTAKLSYGDAIKAYPERFQFLQCQGTPHSIAVRKGTPVMLDNRNTTTYTFKADTQTFVIPGYNYVVFYPEVLGNLVVDCNGKPSVTLNVEK